MKTILTLILLSAFLNANEPIINIKYSNSQIVALEAGFIDRRSCLTSSLQLGIAAQKFRIGCGVVEGGVGAYASGRVVASYFLQTMDYNYFEKKHNYVGVEGIGMIMGLNGALGLFTDVKDGGVKIVVEIGLGI